MGRRTLAHTKRLIAYVLDRCEGALGLGLGLQCWLVAMRVVVSQEYERLSIVGHENAPQLPGPLYQACPLPLLPFAMQCLRHRRPGAQPGRAHLLPL